MIMSEKYLPYRGEIKALIGVGGTVAFVTVHPEKQPTGLYRLDADKLTLGHVALPEGGLAGIADEDALWVAGSDGRIYQCAAKGKPRPLGPQLKDPPLALALLSNQRLAVLAGARVLILARKDGADLQTLELPEPGT